MMKKISLLVIMAMTLAPGAFQPPVSAQTTQTVTVPAERYAAFIVPDPGASLTLTIKTAGDNEMVESHVVPEDTGDKNLWSPSGRSGSAPHVYSSSVILSSCEWLRIHGKYKKKGGGVGHAATVALSEFDVDVPGVDIDISGVTEEKEESEGGFVCVGTTGLRKVTIRQVESKSRFSGTVKLTATGVGTKIRLWDSQARINEITIFPKNYTTPSGLPRDIWVEGIAASAAARDVELKVSYTTPIGNKTTEDKVKLTIISVDIKFADPDDAGWSDLEEKKVILLDKNIRIKLKITPQLPDLQTIFNDLGTALKIRTSGTAASGQDYTLTPQNTTMVQGSGYSEMRVSLTRDQLKTLGVLPNQEADSVTEKAWLDHGSSSSSDPSNLTDGNAYESGLSDETRGKSTNYGDLESSPPNSPIDKTFFVAAGREIITAEYGCGVSHKRQLMNQSDHFYYSGHGSHADATLQGGFAPGDVTGYWDQDLDYAVIAGCAVLDIKNYRAQSFLPLTWLQWYAAGGDWSPGAQWEPKGPSYLIGYNWTAPLDNQGSAGIISNFLSALGGGASIVTAWKQANDLGGGRNACVIDCSTNPHVYWYWDETSGSPVWTNVIKSGGSW